MYDICFKHICKTNNIGDQVCSPHRYFYFPNKVVEDIRTGSSNAHAIIYGGGAIEYMFRRSDFLTKDKANYKIAWGVGFSRSGMRHPGEVTIADNFNLYGRREIGRMGGEYVPCVSCMSPLFDTKRPIPTNRVVIYQHESKSKFDLNALNKDIPVIDNTYEFSEVIKFLSQAEYIVTDSYHGAYWGTLLGKKVICIAYSSKFYGFKYPPVYAKYNDWQDKLADAISYGDEALYDCRRLNKRFYEKCMDLIL